EPIQRHTLDEFATVFGGCGFRRSSFRPCFGLAEGTLLVTSDRWGTKPPSQSPGNDAADQAVSCGRPSFGTRLLIVDPATLRPCREEETGEIWVAGPSVARGYWNRPEETVRIFRAFSKEGDGPFLRTGDLGFVRGG